MGLGLNDDEKDLIEKFLNYDAFPEEEITKRQWQILDAAVKVFSEKGFEGSRTSDIAKEAEVAEGTIFKYFKTKKDILRGLMIPLMVKFFRPMMFVSLERIMENKNNKPIEELMKDIMKDRLELAKKNKELLKTITLESFYHPEILDPIQKQIAPKLIPVVDNFMKENMDKGNFRELDPRFVTRTGMSMIIGYYLLTSIFPEIFKVEDEHEEIGKLVDLFLNGIGRKGE